MKSARVERWTRLASVPRVRIEYETPQRGCVELPFVMGVLAPLSGHAPDVRPVSERRFHEVGAANFDAHLRSLKPRLSFMVRNALDDAPSELAIEAAFECLDDFAPAALARNVAPLARLLEIRKALLELEATLASTCDAAGVCANVERDSSGQQSGTARGGAERLAVAVETAIVAGPSAALRERLARSDGHIPLSVLAVREMIGELDRRWIAQLNYILHHPALKQLEASWRGLHFLVTNSSDDPLLKIRVLNITKRELQRVLKQYKGASWQQSAWFQRVHEDEYGSFGGQPYGCLIADFEFDHSTADTELLGEVAKTCAAAHVPFISGAAPGLFLIDAWPELAAKRDLGAIFATAEHAAFRTLRDAEDARYLGLALPRFLARMPYGARSSPVEELAFEEDTGGGHPDHFCWANAAYAFGVVVNRAFAEFGWCSRIRGVQSGGLLSALAAFHVDADEPDVDVRCALEVSLVQESEAALARCGLIPLLAVRGTPGAVFYGASSLQAPPQYAEPEEAANARLAAQLPYLFAVCRFAHYLKVIARDRLVGSYRSTEDTQTFLQQWVVQYVHGSPEQASEAEKAQRPLAAATVELAESSDDPAYLIARFRLQPHYQLEGLTTTLRLRDRVRSPAH